MHETINQGVDIWLYGWVFIKTGEFLLKRQILKDFCNLIYGSFTRIDIICVQSFGGFRGAVPQRAANL